MRVVGNSDPVSLLAPPGNVCLCAQDSQPSGVRCMALEPLPLGCLPCQVPIPLSSPELINFKSCLVFFHQEHHQSGGTRAQTRRSEPSSFTKPSCYLPNSHPPGSFQVSGVLLGGVRQP